MSIPSLDQSFWTMVEAIGTVSAALVALFGLFYFEILRPLLRRPSLHMQFEARNPYSSLTHLVIGGTPPRAVTSMARTIRVGIRNSAKTPARGVRAKLSRLAGHDAIQNDALIPYDLPWVDTQQSRREMLCKDEEALVEVLIGVQDDPGSWWLQPYDFLHAAGFGNVAGLPTTPHPPFRAYIELTAYAENLASPVTQVFQIDFEEPTKLGALTMNTTDTHIRPMPVIRQ